MKLNRKGFMMAEVVVVSSVILIVLTTLYISYNKIFSLYETRLNYEDSNLIYSLAYYRDFAIESGELTNAINNFGGSNFKNPSAFGIGTNDLIRANNNMSERLYLVKCSNLDLFKDTKNNGKYFFEKTFREYLSYLSSSKAVDNVNYIMVLARCNRSKEDFTVLENCKYAHLNLEI